MSGVRCDSPGDQIGLMPRAYYTKNSLSLDFGKCALRLFQQPRFADRHSRRDSGNDPAYEPLRLVHTSRLVVPRDDQDLERTPVGMPDGEGQDPLSARCYLCQDLRVVRVSRTTLIVPVLIAEEHPAEELGDTLGEYFFILIERRVEGNVGHFGGESSRTDRLAVFALSSDSLDNQVARCCFLQCAGYQVGEWSHVVAAVEKRFILIDEGVVKIVLGTFFALEKYSVLRDVQEDDGAVFNDIADGTDRVVVAKSHAAVRRSSAAKSRPSLQFRFGPLLLAIVWHDHESGVIGFRHG